MATKTIKLTTYTSVTVTYSVSSTDTTTTMSITNLAWKNTRSNGLTTRCEWQVDAASSYFTMTGRNPSISTKEVSGSASKGTKSWSKAVSWSWSWTRTHAIQPKCIYLAAQIIDTSDGDEWISYDGIDFFVPMKPSYTVAYNTNGGTGAPSNQTKWYGETLALTSAQPTRSGYQFAGWNTAADGSGTSYTSGDSYTANAALALYAQWEPAISSVALDVSTIRVDSSSATSESDDGEHCYGTVDYAVTGEAAGTLAFSVAVEPIGPTLSYSTDPIAKGAGADLTGTFVFRASDCDTDTNYTFTVTATAVNTSSTQTIAPVVRGNVLSAAYFTMDVLGDKYWDPDTQTGEKPGHGIAFGEPAKEEGFFVGMAPFVVRSIAGVIQMFAGATPPAGWLICDGSAVSRTDYPELFVAIGSGATWGAGDGSTTFNLPDLRGRAPIGAGTGSGLSARTLGGKVGAETHTLTSGQIPAHSHAFPYPTFGGDSGKLHYETGGAISGSGSKYAYIDGDSTNRYPASTNNNTGGGGAHNNMQPSAVVNFIICTGRA